MAKILIVEKDASICLLVQKYLGRDGHCVNICESSKKCLADAYSFSPDLVVLGEFSDCDACELANRVRQQTDPLIMMVGRYELQDRIRALREGVDYVLLKPFDLEEVRAVVNALLRRASQIDERRGLTFGDLQIDRNRRVVKFGGEVVKLCKLEYKFLLLLAENADSVVEYKEIIEGVWGRKFEANDVNLIRVYLYKIRNLISKKLIVNVYGSGCYLDSKKVMAQAKQELGGVA